MPHEAQWRVAWTKGQWVLSGDPLSAVVREINRYHRRQMVIAAPVFAQVAMGGTIDPAEADYHAIVGALGTSLSIEVDDSDPSIVRLFRRRAAVSNLSQ